MEQVSIPIFDFIEISRKYSYHHELINQTYGIYLQCEDKFKGDYLDFLNISSVNASNYQRLPKAIEFYSQFMAGSKYSFTKYLKISGKCEHEIDKLKEELKVIKQTQTMKDSETEN